MASNNDSIFGPLKPILVPEEMVKDHRKFGRALLAWDYRISPDHVQLLEMIAAGLKNEEIAEKLNLSQLKTANSRIQELYRKLGVSTRAGANGIAAQYGIISEKSRNSSR